MKKQRKIDVYNLADLIKKKYVFFVNISYCQRLNKISEFKHKYKIK
jgi:hypothetical protein